MAVAVGTRAADLKPHVPAQRLPSLEPSLGPRRNPWASLARRAAFVAVSLGALLLGILALNKIGLNNIATALLQFGPELDGFPFLSQAPLAATYLVWAAVWVAMVWGLAALSFRRKDL